MHIKERGAEGREGRVCQPVPARDVEHLRHTRLGCHRKLSAWPRLELRSPRKGGWWSPQGQVVHHGGPYMWPLSVPWMSSDGCISIHFVTHDHVFIGIIWAHKGVLYNG